MTSPAATPSLLPLLGPRDLRQPIAWRAGQPISGRRYLADVTALAERLPEGAQLVNLCIDRYAFSVAFGAALVRGRTSLLPPNARPETLAELRAAHGALLAVSEDAALQVEGMATLVVPLPPTDAAGPGAEPDVDLPVPQVRADLVAACLLTSGSTGVPQPHGKRWFGLTLNVDGAARRLADHLGPDAARLNVVATVPPQHSYGFESGVLLAMLGGAALEAGRPFYPADIAESLARLPRPRALVTTPFHLKALLGAGVRLPVVDLVLCATAPLSPQLARQAEAALGGPLVEIYGCTEAGQVATRRTAVGEVWCTFGDLRLWREGGGADDSAESYWVQGGPVFEATRLGDVLRLEGDRHFELLGRANDLIHVAGRRSSLGHLNYHLNSLEGVLDGAFWLPDELPDRVVRPVAFVVAPGLRAADVIRGLRQRLEAVFVPRRVLHVDALPREATGKLTQQTLRQFALAQLARHEADAGARQRAEHGAGPGADPGVNPGAAPAAVCGDPRP